MRDGRYSGEVHFECCFGDGVGGKHVFRTDYIILGCGSILLWLADGDFDWEWVGGWSDFLVVVTWRILGGDSIGISGRVRRFVGVWRDFWLCLTTRY